MTSNNFADEASGTNTRTYLVSAPFVWGILAIWGLLAAYLAAQGVFASDPREPPLAVVVAALAPALAFLLAFLALAPMRAWVTSLDIAELVGLQTWRVIGIAFLFAWSLGRLPAVFALPAGLGDVAVGVAAVPAAIAAARVTKGWRLAAYGVTFAGLTDFIIAFATGILSRDGGLLHFNGEPASTALGELPFSLFPTFIVPAFLILHAITLLKLQRLG